MRINIPKETLKRLAHYHFYLRQMKANNREFVSNERLSTDLNLSISVIREDLENLRESLGISDIHKVENLLSIVEIYLGYNQKNTAFIVGAGNLGRALLDYGGFKTCGLEIITVFDNNPEIIGSKISGIEVFPVDRLEELAGRMKVNIGIITTPPEPAQKIANMLVEGGVRGIWNFSSAVIKVPEEIVLSNTSLYNDYLELMQRMSNAPML